MRVLFHPREGPVLMLLHFYLGGIQPAPGTVLFSASPLQTLNWNATQLYNYHGFV